MSNFFRIVLLKWQLLRCEHIQTNMTRIQKMTLLTEDNDTILITISRSGRQIRVHFRLDFSSNLIEK